MMMTTGNKEAEIASGLTGTTINWVDNLAGLRAMTHAMTTPVVVKGYGSAGDGGAGIQLNGTSRVVSVVGNKVRSNPTAISIAAGADHFTVLGNTCVANATIANAAGTGPTRVVTGKTK